MSTSVELGLVTEQELEQIQEIFSRKTALLELSTTLAERGHTSNDLYERVVRDLAAISQSMANWWERTSSAHDWEYSGTDSWSLDFGTRTLTLRKASHGRADHQTDGLKYTRGK